VALLEGAFLAVGEGVDSGAVAPGGDEVVACRLRATLAERLVVFGRPAFVAMTFDRDLDVGMFAEVPHVVIEGGASILAKGVRIEVEECRNQRFAGIGLLRYGNLSVEVGPIGRRGLGIGWNGKTVLGSA
jgi:hypothetical protein